MKQVEDLLYKNERLDKENRALLDSLRSVEREKNALKEQVSDVNRALVHPAMLCLSRIRENSLPSSSMGTGCWCDLITISTNWW